MIWDNVAGFYDLAETLYNKEVYLKTGRLVADELEPDDTVLECACGTGSITVHAAQKCRRLIATDRSAAMLSQARINCAGLRNVRFMFADLTALNCSDNRFDKVIAGNVIHLLDDPRAAVRELERVCKPGGKLIIPTYINAASGSQHFVSKLLEAVGVEFKSEFDMYSYRKFFADMGYQNVEYRLAAGRMDCAVAVINI